MKRILFLNLFLLVTIGAAGGANAAYIKGNTTTAPYYSQDTLPDQQKDYMVFYEFLDVGVYDVGISGIQFYIGGWARWDAVDKMDPKDNAAGDGDLGTAYFRWAHEDGWMDLSLGRRFVVMGPVAERIDGLDFTFEPSKGFGIQGFAGIPVLSQIGERDGDYGYGGRVFLGRQPYFSVGFSYAGFTEKGDPDRESVGGDFSVTPIRYFDLLGHAYFSTLLLQLYDTDATLVVRPVNALKILAQYQYQMPSAYLGLGSIFSVFTFNTITKVNTQANYTLKRRVTLLGEYNHYIYDEFDPADRYGGSAGVLWGEKRNNTFNAGAYKLDKTDNGYLEIRSFVHQDLGKIVFLTADGAAYMLDEKINNEDQGYYGSFSAGTHIRPDMDFQLSGIYMDSPEYAPDIRGLAKFTYRFMQSF